jgi:hypothetical protein
MKKALLGVMKEWRHSKSSARIVATVKNNEWQSRRAA